MPKAKKIAGLVMGAAIAGPAIVAIILLSWPSFSYADMSIHGWIAMALGVGFTILVGGGLMALVFYSDTNGYDDIELSSLPPTDPRPDP